MQWERAEVPIVGAARVNVQAYRKHFAIVYRECFTSSQCLFYPIISSGLLKCLHKPLGADDSTLEFRRKSVCVKK